MEYYHIPPEVVRELSGPYFHNCEFDRMGFLLTSTALAMNRKFIQELRGDAMRGAINIYDHIDEEELRRSYLTLIPLHGI